MNATPRRFIPGARSSAQHAGRDFALRDPDIHPGIRRSVGGLLDDDALLVGNDRVAAFQNLQRAELGEVRNQRI